MGSGPAGTQIESHRECWHCRQCLYLLPHNAGPEKELLHNVGGYNSVGTIFMGKIQVFLKKIISTTTIEPSNSSIKHITK